MNCYESFLPVYSGSPQSDDRELQEEHPPLQPPDGGTALKLL
jgi:hypothetical protein